MSLATSKRRVLLTNDDGFDAPGMAALIDATQKISDEIWVVAPQLDQSGMGQSLTLNNPLRCVGRGEKTLGRFGNAGGLRDYGGFPSDESNTT